jgi:hypothetical protein
MTTPIRRSWAIPDPAGQSDGEIDSLDGRYAMGAGWWPGTTMVRKRGGLAPGPGTPGVVTASGGSNVSIAPFQGIFNPVRSDAPYVQTSAVPVVFDAFATPPSTLANRRDLIILRQNDPFNGDASAAANFEYIVGNAPAADPPIPNPAQTDYVVWAQVTVRQNAANVVQGDILGRLPTGYTTVALGGVLPVPSAAVRDAITTPYTGMVVHRDDRGWLETYRGGAWRAEQLAKVATVAALADITHPETNQCAVVAETSMIYRYNGAAWVGFCPLGGTTAATRHEARYSQVGNVQTINNTASPPQRVLFNTTLYDTTDVSIATVVGGSEFTLNRAGLWAISFGVRLAAGAAATERYLGLVDSADFTKRWAGQVEVPGGVVPTIISTATQTRFAAAQKLAVICFQSSGAGLLIDNNAALGENTFFSATWLRP